MTESKISYVKFSFNSWKICSHVSPGCDNCYAERFRFSDPFGPKEPRQRMGEGYWKTPKVWNGRARRAGERYRVLCGSMCDWADNMAPAGEREKLFNTIEETEYLDWLLLTKRAQNIPKYIPSSWHASPPDNVWLGVSVENREHGLPRIDILREQPARIRWLSVEPLLEDLGPIDLTGIDWVVCGGESGPCARPMDPAWAVSVKNQCVEQGVPFYFKQLSQEMESRHYGEPAYFPVDLRTRNFPVDWVL